MTRNKPFKILLLFVFILTGALASWYFYFFKPYFKPYYPVTYQPFPAGITGNAFSDSVFAAPGLHYYRSGFGRFWLGMHNRQLWTTPVNVPVFHFNKPPHFLKILKRGGGMQTTSFTLVDKAGKPYALRSVDKNPSLVLPAFWRHTLVREFVQDQVSAADPYASLVVAALGKAVGIKQVFPELVFVLPGNPSFQKFGVEAGGFFFLNPKLVDPAELKLPDETYSGVYATEEMFQHLTRNAASASIDTAYYLRCRLFDLLISDWDRHAGQWDWMAFSGKSGTVFRPVPKDRDQAFSYYEDGFLPTLLASNFGVRKITSFTPNYKDIKGFTMNGSVLDLRFFKSLKPEHFVNTARNMQAALPDSVLEAALKHYPREVYPERAPVALGILRARRNKLHEAALEYYRVYAEQ